MYFHIETTLGTTHFFESGYFCQIANPRKAVSRHEADAVMTFEGKLFSFAIITNPQSLLMHLHYRHDDGHDESIAPTEAAALKFYEQSMSDISQSEI